MDVQAREGGDQRVITFVLALTTVLVAVTPARIRWRSGSSPGLTLGPDVARGGSSRLLNLLRRKRSGSLAEDGALVLDLLAAAGQAGLPLPAALIAAGRAAGGRLGEAVACAGTAVMLGADLAETWQLPPPQGASGPAPGLGESGGPVAEELALIREQVLLVHACGAPGAALLHAAADGVRRRRRRRREAAAAALSVRLVLPMGLCALPAFLALSVVPVVLSMLSGVLG